MQMTKHSVRSLIVDFSSSLRSLNIASHAYSCCAFTADYPKTEGHCSCLGDDPSFTSRQSSIQLVHLSIELAVKLEREGQDLPHCLQVLLAWGVVEAAGVGAAVVG